MRCVSGIIAEGFDPVHVGLAAKPGELALGVVAMALLGFGDGYLLADALEENGHAPDGSRASRAP